MQRRDVGTAPTHARHPHSLLSSWQNVGAAEKTASRPPRARIGIPHIHESSSSETHTPSCFACGCLPANAVERAAPLPLASPERRRASHRTRRLAHYKLFLFSPSTAVRNPPSPSSNRPPVLVWWVGLSTLSYQEKALRVCDPARMGPKPRLRRCSSLC